MYYTIGQRKGLNIENRAVKYFVVGKDVNNKILYVAAKEDNDYLFSDEAVIDTINWISDIKPSHCTAKFRYRQKEVPVDVEYHENEIIVRYKDKVRAVTPGQACVFYNGEECLGGGIIKEVRKNEKKLWYL